MAFDGSVLVDRTAGQIGARCDHEAYNTLTLNLCMEILQGRRTIEDARRLYGETAAVFVMGRSAPYAEGLLFTPLDEDTADPDECRRGRAGSGGVMTFVDIGTGNVDGTGEP
ncbi:hypothetical protein HDA32_000579 [Spinactinospora alkalitolerans]|uniref:Uncharacterized protein n=1 Tax=Spinactinospora alkalitolerans TaxID=687207 RepID=A0A852TNB4_9ACTN|nr:hypothetical protein [Spinactinospora alkalitolerans]NYE45459.1 hypothetical protein [Spinactinospora alkalitolerans]